MKNLERDKRDYWGSFRCSFGLHFLLLTRLFYNSVKRDVTYRFYLMKRAKFFYSQNNPKVCYYNSVGH